MARFIRASVALTDLSRDEVTYLQNLLKRYGYDPGEVDGVMGPRTQQAYLAFAEANGQPTTGVTGSLISMASDSDLGAEVEASIKRGTGPVATGTVAQPAPATAPPPLPATTIPAPPPSSVSAAPAPPTQTPEVTASDAEIDKEIYRKYPTMAPYLDHPEVGPLLRWAAREGMTDGELEAQLHNTWWWKLTDSKIRQWDRLFTDDPAEAQRLMKVKGAEIYTTALQRGVPMSESDAEYLAGRVLREGWSDIQLSRFYGALVRNVGFNPGQITEIQAELRKLGQQYMVPLRNEDVNEWATRVLEGTATKDTYMTTLRNDAMNRFYWMKDQIEGGATPEDLFRGLKNTVAQTLEINPMSINFNDPSWADLANPVGNGKDARMMSYTEAQSWARRRPEWRRTQNANDGASQTASFLLRAMGVIK